MARRKESPHKAAMREMMRGYLKENDISIKDGTDVNAVMRDMMSVLLQGVLDEELDEGLGYSKYDYRNKDTDNSRNGHSKKPCTPAMGICRWLSPVTATATMSHSLSRSTRMP